MATGSDVNMDWLGKRSKEWVPPTPASKRPRDAAISSPGGGKDDSKSAPAGSGGGGAAARSSPGPAKPGGKGKGKKGGNKSNEIELLQTRVLIRHSQELAQYRQE